MHIKLDNVSVRFPIFDTKQRSFKQTLLNAATGGRIIDTGKYTEVEALKNITLDIKEGDRIALLGHNGSGKTTLLRVMAGVYTPTAGKISIKGKVTSLLDSMLGMDGEATGIENIFLRGLFLGLTSKRIKELVDDIVDFSELGNFITMPVRIYSSGMVLRLAFAISTAIQPEILIMDEWMIVGDENFRQKAESRLNSFVNTAAIVILATHNLNLAKITITKKIEINHGKIKKD